MAFFDNNIFNPQTYQGGMSGWLAEALRSGLLGRALPDMQPQTGPTFASGNQGSMGGVPFPIMGQPEPAAIPQAAQPAQYSAPQPSFGDKLRTAAQILDPTLINVFSGGKPTDDIREFEYAKRQGFQGTLADWIQRKRSGAGEYGLQPVWGVGPDGKPAVLQLGKGGTAIQSKLPEGFQIAREPIKMDAGTHWVILDPQTRQPVATVPKDLKGAEEAKKFGASQGEAKGELASQTSKMAGLETVVRRLDDLSNRATYTLAGQAIDAARRQAGLEPRESSVARVEYEAVVNNQILPLLRDTFGAQFTEREGATLRATLGDPNKSPQEKQAVLRSFIEQKRRDIEALKTRTGDSTPAPSQPDSGWDTFNGVRIRKRQQ